VPANTMNGAVMGGREPLINDETAEKDVDGRPSIQEPGGGRDVSLMALGGIIIDGAEGAVDGGREEVKVHEDVRDLEQDVKV